MEYRIVGTTMPFVELSLNKGETIRSQAGSMKWMTEGIEMDTGITGGVMGALKRKFVGEGIFMNYFTGKSNAATVAFGHTYPGMIIPLDLSVKSYICQRRAFLCSTEDVNIDMAFHKKLRVGLFGGEGIIMQKLSGNGTAFIEIDGECVEIHLAPNQSIKVETGAVGAFEESVKMDISLVKGLGNLAFGGEGLFLTTLTGPGHVWLQTMPVQGMVAEMAKYIPRKN